MFISYDYYRVFYYVAKCRNFTQAASLLMSNQPNVTRTIQNLESQLGCTLFVRSNRGVRLTPEGERLYSHIRIAVEQIHAGEEELSMEKKSAERDHLHRRQRGRPPLLSPAGPPELSQPLAGCAPADLQSFHAPGPLRAGK